ncbi:MAG: hypothetical protein Q8L87_06835 [Anaerolineales bacterium]|nr:hypothetical protein [Anaerolineales bacterium]
MISLKIINKILSRRAIWIQGYNRSGKTALALDIAEVFLKSNWRLVSNLNCVWNELLPIDLDSNKQLNALVVLDEAGVFMRTKESIRLIMGAKGKLNCVFLLPSTEAPHEDLWGAYIEPHYLLNWGLEKFFGRSFVENYLKVWKFIEFDPKTGYKTTLFLQYHPKSYYYLYSTLSFGISVEDILSQFQKSLSDQQESIGNTNPLGLYDVATKRSGIGEASSFLSQQVATFQSEGRRKLFSSKSK